jgi:hypothetical protein
MQRQSVQSSNLRSVGYDAQSNTLEIEFNTGGVYQYFDVPANVYQGLISASSHGTYFHNYIKSSYRYTRIR